MTLLLRKQAECACGGRVLGPSPTFPAHFGPEVESEVKRPGLQRTEQNCRIWDVRGEVAEDLTHLLRPSLPTTLWVPASCCQIPFSLFLLLAAPERDPKTGYLFTGLLAWASESW